METFGSPFHPRPAARTGTRQTLMARHHRQDRRQLNAVMGSDHLARRIRCEHMPTASAPLRAMVDNMIGILRK